MIVAIEGCDRSGKSTLFAQLQKAVPFAIFGPSLPNHIDLKPVMHHVEELVVALWTSLYQSDKVYITDRSPFVSNVVYSEIYNRPPVAYPQWRSELRVIYLRPPIEVLKSRGTDAWNPDFEREREVYDKVISPLQHIEIFTVDNALEIAIKQIYTWCNAEASRVTQLKQLYKTTRNRSVYHALRILEQRQLVTEMKRYWYGSVGQLLGIPAVGACIEQEKPASAKDKSILKMMPKKPSGMVLCHRCDNRRCVNPMHLFWGTQRDNVRDMSLKSRMKGRPYQEKLERAEAELTRRIQEAVNELTG